MGVILRSQGHSGMRLKRWQSDFEDRNNSTLNSTPYCHYVLTQNSIDVFHITVSKWKVWPYCILCWVIACIPLLPIVLFTGSLLAGDEDVSSDIMVILVICIPLFLFFVSIGVIFLKKLNKPIATLTRNGFSGTKNFKNLSFAWTPDTVIFNGAKGSIILANLDLTQSRASKLWGGPKEAAIIYNFFAKQKRHEVLEAVKTLSPYPVEQTTIWKAAK